MPKLFKKISLLAKNSGLVKRNENYKREDKLKITKIYYRDKTIDRYFKNSKF